MSLISTQSRINQQSSLLNEGDYSFHGSTRVGRETRRYFREADPGSMTSTLYQPAHRVIESDFQRASGQVILNMGKLTEDGEVDHSSVASYQAFQQRMERGGIRVNRFSNPESNIRLHMKTYTATQQGRATALISTSNLSSSSMIQPPSSQLMRRAGKFFGRSDLYQLNMAVEVRDPSVVNQLTQIQNQLASNQIPSSTRNFLVGGDVSKSLVQDLGRAGRGQTVTVTAPYLDDVGIVNALAAASERGAKVNLLTSNPRSTEERATGGNEAALARAIQMLQTAGANIYMPEANDPLLVHYKAVSITGGVSIGYVGSHNLTRAASAGESIDLMMRSEGSLGSRIQSAALSDAERFGLKKIQGVNTSSAGFTNSQLSGLFSESYDTPSFILPSKHGLSHFYELAIFNARMNNAGLTGVDLARTEGYASAAYTIKYTSINGTLPQDLPWYVTLYDEEMNRPGLGYYINSWGISNGYGRLYKDELGAMGSLGSAIGRVLDQAYTYYNSSNPDYTAQFQTTDPYAVFTEPQKGIFESTLGFAASFINTTGMAVLTYFTLGMPYNLLMSEVAKLGTQGVLDTALSSDKISSWSRSSAIWAVLGDNFLQYSDDPEALKKALVEELKKGESSNLYKSIGGPLQSFTSLQRRRSGILFDNVIDPFISNYINPYATVGSESNLHKWQEMRNSLSEFREAIAETPWISLEEGSFKVTGRGYEWQRKVAGALDDMAVHIPRNPMLWSWGRVGYSAPKDFISIAEVFSFTELVDTIENSMLMQDITNAGKLAMGGKYNSVVAAAQTTNNTNALTRATAKIATAARFPVALAQMGVNRFLSSSLLGGDFQVEDILPENWKDFSQYKTRFQDGLNKYSTQAQAANSVRAEHRKLMSMQQQLVEKGILYYDDDNFIRKFKSSLNTKDQELLYSFFDQMQLYKEKVESLPESGKALIDKANRFQQAQNLRLGKLAEAGKKLQTDPFNRSRGLIGIVAGGFLLANALIDDVASTTKGASLLTQFLNSQRLFNSEYTTPTEFTATNFFSITHAAASIFTLGNAPAGFSYAIADSIIWNGGILLAANELSKRMVGGDLAQYTTEGLTFKGESPQLLKDWQATFQKRTGGRIASAKMAEEFGEFLQRGAPLLRGNRLSSFLMTAGAMMAASRLSVHLGAGFLSLARGIPGIGPALLGKGDVKPNENLMLVKDLGVFRNNVYDRFMRGENVSAMELQGAYIAGIFAANTSIVTANKMRGHTQVIAQQAPLPYFQFFFAETIKGAAPARNKNGTVTYSLGMQTAPILGGNFTLSLPFKLNRDAENFTGRSLMYNEEDHNILNYLGAVATLSGQAGVVAATALIALEGTAGAAEAISTRFNRKTPEFVQDLRAASSLVRTVSSTFEGVGRFLLMLPDQTMNMGKGILLGHKDLIETAYRSVKGEGVKLPTWYRSSRALAVGLVTGIASSYITDFFSDDPTFITQIGGAISVGAGLVNYISSRPVNSNPDPTANRPLRSIKSVSNKAFETLDKNILQRVPQKRYLAPVAIGMTAAWLMTSSWFGYSRHMDTNPVSQGALIATLGIGMGVTFAKFGDMGRGTEDTIQLYRQMQKLSESDPGYNPFSWMRKQYAKSRAVELKGDVLHQLRQVKEFTLEYGMASSKLSQKVDRIELNSSRNTAASATQKAIDTERADRIKSKISGNIELDLQNVDLVKDTIEVSEMKGYKAWYQSRNLKTVRFMRGAVKGTVYLPAVLGAVMAGIGQIQGGVEQEGINRFYNWLEDSRNLGGMPTLGIRRFIGNSLRLVTGKDKVNFDDADLRSEMFRDQNDRALRQMGSHLIRPNDPQYSRFNNVLKDLIAPVVFDPGNSFVALGPGIGITFRSGEFGTRANAYIQLQSAGQDISSAVYSMAPATLIKDALAGTGEYRNTVLREMHQYGIKNMSNLSPQQAKIVSAIVLGASSKIQPLNDKQKRRFTNPAMDQVTNLIAGSTLLSMSIRERIRRTEELSVQPWQSVVGRMIDPSDPSSMMTQVGNRLDPNNPLASFNNALKGMDQAFLGAFSGIDRMLTHIHNPLGRLLVQGYSVSVKKEHNKVQYNEMQMQDTSEWLQYSSMYLDNLDTAKEPGAFSFIGNLLGRFDAMFSNLFNYLPFGNVIKTTAYLAAGLGAGAIGLGMISAFMFKQESAEILQALDAGRDMLRLPQIEDGEVYRFKVERNPIPGTKGTQSRYRVTDRAVKTRSFTLLLPEGMQEVPLSSLNDALQSIQMQINPKYNELLEEVVDGIGKSAWKGKARSNAVDEITQSTIDAFDKYIDDIFKVWMTSEVEGLNFSTLISRHGNLDKIKAEIKAEVKSKIHNAIESNIHSPKRGGGVLGDDLLSRHIGIGDAAAPKYLAGHIMDEVKGLLETLRNNLILLEPTDLTSMQKFDEYRANLMQTQGANKQSIGAASSNLKVSRSSYLNVLSQEDLKLITPGAVKGAPAISNVQGRARLSYKAGAGHLFQGIATGLGVGESLDLLTSYTRLAAAQESELLSDFEQRAFEQHAGAVTINSFGIGLAMNWVSQKVFKNADKLFGKTGKGTATRLGLLVAGIGLLMMTRNKLAEGVEQVTQSELFKTASDFISTAYDSSASFIGDLLGDKLPEIISGLPFVEKHHATTAIGSALTVLSFTTLARGVFSVKLGSALKVGGIFTALNTALSFIPGYTNFMGRYLGQIANQINKIPGIGALITTSTDEIYNFKSNQWNEPGAPIDVGTAPQIIASDRRQYLFAASDPTGNQSKRLFTNKTLYGQSYGDSEPIAGAFGSPLRNFVDPLLDRELAIKSQYYNQSIVGASVWSSILRTARDYAEMREITIQQNLGNPKAAQVQKQIEGQQQAELAKVKKDLAAKASGESPSIQAQTNLAAKIFSTITSFVEKKDDKVNTTLIIAKQDYNPLLKQRVEETVAAKGQTPILSTQIVAKNNGNNITVEETPGNNNDLLLAITQGRINPIAFVQQGYSLA